MANIVFNQTTTVVAAPRSVSASMEGKEVILNLHSGIYYALDKVGARIWSLIEEPRSVGQILEVLLAEYEVDPERCHADLVALLGELSEVELVEIRDAASSGETAASGEAVSSSDAPTMSQQQ